MTPAARVQAAIEALDKILAGAAAEQVLTAWARGARYAGSKDRAAVRDHVFQALRCKRSYAALGGAETGRGLMLGHLRAQRVDPDTVFTGEGHAPAPLTGPEGAAGHAPDGTAAYDLPDWLWPRFEAALGHKCAAVAARHLQERAPVTLRVNHRKASTDKAIGILAKEGVETRRIDAVSTALLVTEGTRRIAQTKAYTDGVVELQDASSQAAMERLVVPDGARVLDFCAGGGGKVLALAARQNALWFAHDAAPERLRDLPARAARAGAKVNLLTLHDVVALAPFDVILCDVPCSGSGTWRRAPEAKWRLRPERLKELQNLQAQILRETAPLVRSGGVLAYATCSVLQEENETQASDFVKENPDWRLEETIRWPISATGDGFFLVTFRAPA